MCVNDFVTFVATRARRKVANVCHDSTGKSGEKHGLFSILGNHIIECNLNLCRRRLHKRSGWPKTPSVISETSTVPRPSTCLGTIANAVVITRLILQHEPLR